MKLLTLPLLLSFSLLFFSLSFASPPPGYSLVWSDEFNGPLLDTINNWSFDTVNKDMGSSIHFFTKHNLTIENGAAALWTRNHDTVTWLGMTRHYTGCQMTTQCKKEFKYGYIEARLKSPEGDGVWTMFWTLGSGFPLIFQLCPWIDTLFWPACGELSLFGAVPGSHGSFRGLGDSAFEAYCFFANAQGGASYHSAKHHYTESLGMQYHLYALEWDSTRVQYYFDNEKFWEYDSINESYNFAAFHRPHYLIASIQPGGTYQGMYIDNAIFPLAMYLDYVRVYQKSTQARPGRKGYVLPDRFFIDGPSRGRLMIYDLRGRLVVDLSRRVMAGENVRKIISTSLPAGVYVVKFSDGIKMVSERYVKPGY